MENYKIPANTRIGHVHLKVSDLQKSLDFYCGLLGFELMMKYGARRHLFRQEDTIIISA